MRPRIGITLSTTGMIAESRDWREHYRYYFDAVREAGGDPVALTPDAVDPAHFDLNRIDGLLLSGGGDIEPGRYGESANGTEVEGLDPARDELELILTRRAVARDMPVLGICRGIQTLNVALGGGLLQHVAGHRMEAADAKGWAQHWVEVTPGSRLAAILGSDGQVVVNSHHHQAVTPGRLAPDLIASALAVPGGQIVEAVEHPGRRWVIAVEWHPERRWEVPETQARLFESFIQVASPGGGR